ncbi:MAG TPA: TIR domain-containing protein, partial [Pseudonocardiaceae bacterium]|nr:TIR domain-containing protein [Pseudonocardiaceae bacterium]
RLGRDLYAIAKRHPGGSELAIFLDTAALRPGRLDERIFAEVRRSRYLIVLCGPGTATSEWVSDEISHWLATVGAPERLFLIRTDNSVDLTWDKETQRFHRPEDVPKPLRHLFEAEQKWIDYTGRALVRQTAGLTGMCAELMSAEVKDFLQEETDFQRRRTRIVSAVATVTALLLVAAIISGITAVRNAQEARDNAARAAAQADAAEALLAANSPTVAIERALRATAQSDSPTVRSAMLAVSQATARLKRALVFPEGRTGHPVAGAGFSATGAKLLAWGADATPGTSLVRMWDLATGVVEADVRTPVPALRDVRRVDDRRLAACGAAGPVVIDIVGGRVTRLDDGWREGPGRTCQVYEYADGVVVLGTSTAGGGSALSADRGGAVTRIAGVDTVAAHPSARSALAAGPAGAVLVTPGRQVQVSPVPAAATFADSHGTFLLTTGPRDWAFVTRDGAEPVMRTVTLPEITADVAPLLDIGLMTGELAWITADGTLGWTGDDHRTQLTDSQGQPAWTPYAPTLEPLGTQDFVAVYRNTATLVRPPTGEYPSDAPPGTPRPTTD